MTTDAQISTARSASTRPAGARTLTSRRDTDRPDVARDLPGYPVSKLASVGFVAGLLADGRPAA